VKDKNKEKKEKKIEITFGNTGVKIVAKSDSNFEIVNPIYRTGKKTIIGSNAINLFEFKLKRIEILIKYIKKGDFLFETTLCRQIIVILTTAFEIYARMRFLELEKEGLKLNMDILYEKFIPEDIRQNVRELIKRESINEKRSELEIFIERRNINFQEWASFKKAYNKGYGLIIGNIEISNDILIYIQKLIEWRHKIIHSIIDSLAIDIDKNGKSIDTNERLAKISYKAFKKFIELFHKKTLELVDKEK